MELTKEQQQYLTDDMYLPIQYKGMKAQKPFFEGRGNHSVAQLEEICEQYQEYCHQQSIIKNHVKECVIELKFGLKLFTP